MLSFDVYKEAPKERQESIRLILNFLGKWVVVTNQDFGLARYFAPLTMTFCFVI